VKIHFDFVSASWVFTLFLSLAACSATAPRFEPTINSYNRVIVTGRLKEARASYQSQAREAEQVALASSSPRSYWSLASANYKFAARAARDSGDVKTAIVDAEKALHSAQRAEDPRLMLSALEEMVMASRFVRNREKANTFLQTAFDVLKQLPPDAVDRDRWEAMLQDQSARMRGMTRDHSGAAAAFQAAIDSYSRWMLRLGANDPDASSARNRIIRLKGRLGEEYAHDGKFEAALEQFQGAFDLINQWNVVFTSEDDLHLGVGNVHLEQGRFAPALESFQKALALGAAQRRARVVWFASTRVGRVLERMNKRQEAMPYFRQAIEQLESIRSLLDSPDDRHSFLQNKLYAYFGMIRALVAAKRWAEAFDYSERARARAFLDVVGTRAALANRQSGLLAEEKALSERIADLKTRAELESESIGVTDVAVELQAAEKAYNQFLLTASKENAEQASLLSVKPLTAREVQQLLDPEASLISYLVSDESIRIWVVEKNRLRFSRVEISRKQLSDLIRQFRESVSNPEDGEKLKAVSTLLHKHLIEPLIPRITGKELIIVPHDVLHYLPFHALFSSDGRYLIESYPISYLSSASLLQFTLAKRRALGERALIFGNPDLGDAAKNLAFAQLEAEEVRSVYPRSDIFLKKDATEEKSKALSANRDILHFATHGELREEDPLSSAVLLAKEDKEDGRLEVREIFGLDLKANLVVLSGCDTALGRLSRGDELVGLTRAFIYAGTPSVVASLWPVDDASTASLMAHFYRNLANMSKVEALRQAQLRLIRGDVESDLFAKRGVGGTTKLGAVSASEGPKNSAGSQLEPLSHPYFWAPFILVGDGK
jgi:CHAT domain-containing protein